MGLADTLNLSEDKFEQILNSEKVKEQIGSYISEVVSSAFNDKDATLTKEKVEIFLNTAVDEYNKVSDTKISDDKRKKIVNSFVEEMSTNMNEEFQSLNLTNDISPENAKYIKLADNILFGNYTLIMLGAIITTLAFIIINKPMNNDKEFNEFAPSGEIIEPNHNIGEPPKMRNDNYQNR